MGTAGVLTATKIQKNVTERCGPEMASSTFRAMTPPRMAETPAITSMTWGRANSKGQHHPGGWGGSPGPRGGGWRGSRELRAEEQGAPPMH